MPDYHSKFENDKYYHIFNRGNNGEDLFLSDDNYRYFLSKWNKYIEPVTKTLAYCLLPNHFHFLVRINYSNLTKPSRLGKVEIDKVTKDLNINNDLEDRFKRLFMSYALAFNKQQDRKGSLFQKGFKRIEIDSDSYLTAIIQYIHKNPFHHGYCRDYADWKYSSFLATIRSNEKTKIARNEVIKWYGDIDNFKLDHENELTLNHIKPYLIE